MFCNTLSSFACSGRLSLKLATASAWSSCCRPFQAEPRTPSDDVGFASAKNTGAAVVLPGGAVVDVAATVAGCRGVCGIGWACASADPGGRSSISAPVFLASTATNPASSTRAIWSLILSSPCRLALMTTSVPGGVVVGARMNVALRAAAGTLTPSAVERCVAVVTACTCVCVVGASVCAVIAGCPSNVTVGFSGHGRSVVPKPFVVAMLSRPMRHTQGAFSTTQTR